MKKIFTSKCPRCKSTFVVSWELRNAGLRLICPICGHRYLPEKSLAIDEREQH